MSSKKSILGVIWAVVAWALITMPAEATLIADWTFDNPVQTVGPTEVITMNATFTNDAASDMNLLGSLADQGEILNGSLVGESNPYNIAFGGPTTTLFEELAAMNLAPGGSFSFIFAVISPKGGAASPGIYSSLGTSIRIDGVVYGGIGDKVFEVTVASETGTGVPEPGTAGLMLLSLAATSLASRRRKTAEKEATRA